MSHDGIKLGLSSGKVNITILGHVYGIIFGIDVGTEMGYLDVSFEGSNDGKFEGLLIGVSLVSTDGKVLVSDEGIIMRLSDSKVLGNIPGNIDEILFGLDVETDLGYLNRSFDTSNDGNFEGFLIRDLL